eukprot:g46852.t1
MDTRVGLSYTCLLVGFVEQALINNCTGTIPHLLLCYIDDCIDAASCSREELEQFINFANTFHHTLKFTISDTSLPFLDLSISISGNQLTTDIHFKPMDSHNYLGYTSSHPPSCKNSIPFSQFLRLCCICSQDEAFYSRNFQISSYFSDRRFPSSVINDALDQMETKRRLGDQIAEHLRSACTNRPKLLVAIHFNSPFHSLSDMSILGLLNCQ